MLLALAEKLLKGESTTTTPTERGTLSEINWRPDTPVYGEVDGVSVTILGMGNMQGLSPAAFCTEASGEGAWLPTSRIRFTDPRLQPIAPHASRGHATTTPKPAIGRPRKEAKTAATS